MALSKEQLWTLVLIGMSCFTTNMCFAARDGYLTIYISSVRHISGTIYGLFKANYIFGYVFMGILNKHLLKRISAKWIILVGLFGHGVCLNLAAAVGYLPNEQNNMFSALTCLLQSVQGCLMSSVTLSCLALGASKFKDKMGKVNGTYYLGAVIPHGIVPVIANIIYERYSYSPPLFLFGTLSFVFSCFLFYIFQQTNLDFQFAPEESAEEANTKPIPMRAYLPLIQSYILTAYLSYLQLTIVKFAKEEIGFSESVGSTLLLVLMLAIATVNIIITYFCSEEPKKILHLLLIACIADSVAAFFLFPSNSQTGWKSITKYIIYPFMIVIGVADAYSTIMTTPAMIYLYSTVRSGPVNEHTKHTMSSFWIAGNGLAYSVGAYLAGLLDEFTTFHEAGIIWGVMAVICVLSLVFTLCIDKGFSGEQYRLFDDQDVPAKSGAIGVSGSSPCVD